MDQKNSKKIIWTIIALLCAVVLVFCIGILLAQAKERQEQRAFDEALVVQVKQTPALTPTPLPTATPSPEKTVLPSPTPQPVPQTVDFDALWQQNPEVIAWLSVDGTVIDYPILCRPGDDAYYMNHNLLGKVTVSGSICIQSDWNKTDFTDFSTVVYGHNMRDGSMFKGLHKFEDADFFEENKTVVIYTPTKRLTYTIFAAYKRDNAHLIYTYDSSTKEGRQAFLDNIYAHTDGNFRDDIAVDTDSRILTLSTCVGGEKDNRYVVQAVLTKEEAVE